MEKGNELKMTNDNFKNRKKNQTRGIKTNYLN